MKIYEKWKWILGYENRYAVSSRGRVKSFCVYKEGKILRPRYDRRRYLVIGLYKQRGGKQKWYKIHRLVATAFIPNPGHLPQINHIDGVKTNNHFSNLEWCTAKQNSEHSVRTKLWVGFGENNINAKLTDELVLEIRHKLDSGKYGKRELARMFEVDPALIRKIALRLAWKHVA